MAGSIVLAVFCGSVLAACGSSDEGEAGGGTADGQVSVAFATLSESSPVFAQTVQQMRAAAPTAGVSLDVYDNNFDPATTLENAKLMVQDGPDVIVEQSAIVGGEDAGAAIGKVFDREGIPCIALGTPTPGCPFLTIDQAASGAELARTVAELADKRGWDASNTTVMIGQASTGGPEVNAGVIAFYSTLSELLPGFEKVAPSSITPTTTTIGDNGLQVDTRGTIDGASQAFSRALQEIPKSRNLIITSVNDDTSIGALRAAQRAGRIEETMIAGVAGSPTGLQQLATNPAWVAESNLFFAEWPQYTFAMADVLANGDSAPEVTYLPQVILTKDNLHDFYRRGHYDEAIKLPPLTPDQRYLASSGVLQKFGKVEGLK